MPLTLHIDVDRWRAHQAQVIGRYPGIVPVIKGNGYGAGLPRLAVEAERLGLDTGAVRATDGGPGVRGWAPARWAGARGCRSSRRPSADASWCCSRIPPPSRSRL